VHTRALPLNVLSLVVLYTDSHERRGWSFVKRSRYHGLFSTCTRALTFEDSQNRPSPQRTEDVRRRLQRGRCRMSCPRLSRRTLPGVISLDNEIHTYVCVCLCVCRWVRAQPYRQQPYVLPTPFPGEISLDICMCVYVCVCFCVCLCVCECMYICIKI
jgi:hypothetical protein